MYRLSTQRSIKTRVEKALERKAEVAKSSLSILEPIHTTLPGEIVSKIVFLADETTQLSLKSEPSRESWYPSRYHMHRFSHSASIISKDGWIAHRLDPSRPATVHVDTRTITERSLRQILSCSGINLAVRTRYSPRLRMLPLLLEYPRRWKRLNIEIDVYDNKYPSFLDTFASVIPYLEEISIRSIGGMFELPIPEESQASLKKWEMTTKLKKATLSLSLLKTFLLLGSLRFVTLLTIHLHCDSDLELMKLISGLPSLEEIILREADPDTYLDQNATIPVTRINRPILCPRLRSIYFDVNISFIPHSLRLFKSTKILKLSISSNSSESMGSLTREFARTLHNAFPGISEFTIGTVSPIIVLH